MADTAVTGSNVVYLTPGTAVASPTGQAVTTGNVAVLTPVAAADGTPDVAGRPFKARYMLVRMVESGSVATSTATVKAGATGGAANLSAYGDATAVTFTSGQTKFLQIDLARHLQADGTVRVAVGGTSGSVTFSVLQLSSSV